MVLTLSSVNPKTVEFLVSSFKTNGFDSSSSKLILIKAADNAYWCLKGVSKLCALEIWDPSVKKVPAIVLSPGLNSNQMFAVLNWANDLSRSNSPLQFADRVDIYYLSV